MRNATVSVRLPEPGTAPPSKDELARRLANVRRRMHAAGLDYYATYYEFPARDGRGRRAALRGTRRCWRFRTNRSAR
jgi:hypothetical protein